MIDDPLSLTMQLVAVLAAGMYPVGFLFGVCSDCCCKPCTKCSHYWNRLAANDPQPACEISAGGSEFDLSYSFGDYGTVTIEGVGLEPCTGRGDGSLEISFDDLPAAPDGLEYATTLPPFLCPIEIVSTETTDSCGCTCCQYEITFRFRVPIDNWPDPSFDVSATTSKLCGCSQTEVNATFSGWAVSNAAVDDQEWLDAVIDILDGIELTASLTIPACDCGACCDDGCEDDVADGACENWAGVGTACDDTPDPCAP